jgi:hypothetical protein
MSGQNHGPRCRDGIFGSLQIKSRTVLDETANLKVYDAKVKGSLKVKEETTLKDELCVDGATTLKDELCVDGATTLKDELCVDGATTLKDELCVDGATTLKDELCVDGTASIKGNICVEGSYKTAAGGVLTSACSTFHTPVTHNWKSVSSSVEVPSGDHVYGQMGGGPDNPGKVMYTVPAGRHAMLMSFAQDGGDPDVRASYGVQDLSGKHYLGSSRGESNLHERFLYLESGDKFVVWGLPSVTFDCAATFIEFDANSPDGCFHKIHRLSTTSTTDSVEYTIPANHSAVLCPNLLPVGQVGDDASLSVVLGRDGDSDSITFRIINCISGTDYVESRTVGTRDPFNTEVEMPRLTTFSAGDKFRLQVNSNGDNHLATITTALFVKPNPM